MPVQKAKHVGKASQSFKVIDSSTVGALVFNNEFILPHLSKTVEQLASLPGNEKRKFIPSPGEKNSLKSFNESVVYGQVTRNISFDFSLSRVFREKMSIKKYLRQSKITFMTDLRVL